MRPGGPLTRRQLTHLRVYTGAEHPHTAQTPDVVNVKAMNRKNDGGSVQA
jgi:large subunit ribosomal protein L13